MYLGLIYCSTVNQLSNLGEISVIWYFYGTTFRLTIVTHIDLAENSSISKFLFGARLECEQLDRARTGVRINGHLQWTSINNGCMTSNTQTHICHSNILKRSTHHGNHYSQLLDLVSLIRSIVVWDFLTDQWKYGHDVKLCFWIKLVYMLMNSLQMCPWDTCLSQTEHIQMNKIR